MLRRAAKMSPRPTSFSKTLYFLLRTYCPGLKSGAFEVQNVPPGRKKRLIANPVSTEQTFCTSKASVFQTEERNT